MSWKLLQLYARNDCTMNVLIYLQHLRQIGVVGKFVEFFGSGVSQLSIADRATISNMCPEYGATVGFFPVDQQSLTYLKQTGKYFLQTFKLHKCSLYNVSKNVCCR